MYPVIVSLDPPKDKDCSWALEIAQSLPVERVKVGLPLILADPTCLQLISRLRYTIADLKLADVGHIMSIVMERLAEAGVRAVIAHAFVGWEGALKEASLKAKELGLDLYLVVSMTHKGFDDSKLYEFINLAYKANAKGVVAPATKPWVIKTVRRWWSREIISPGVGPQGAKPCDAIKAGADYEIVGRLITMSEKPEEVLKQYEKCKG